MQRPLCCAQAPDIFAFVAFACFAANAGDIDAVASAAAIPILTIHFMKTSQIIPKGKVSRLALSGQAWCLADGFVSCAHDRWRRPDPAPIHRAAVSQLARTRRSACRRADEN